MSKSTKVGRFERLVLRNLRCFREAEIELDPQVTVLIGENGSGKTSVVEALASLTQGEGEELQSFPVSRDARTGEASLYVAGQKAAVAVWKSSGKSRRLPEGRYLFAYGRYRRVHFPGADEPVPSSNLDFLLGDLARRAKEGRSVTVFKPDNHLLRDLSRYLAALHLASRADPRLAKIWDRLNASLQELDQGIEGIEIEEGKVTYIPFVVRNGVRLELRELSDGYQAMLVIVFDLILRYLYLFQSLDDPLLGEATVAIDEVDLHLHPRWQRTVVRQLVRLFPKTQFLLTTHSAAVVQGAIDSKRTVVTLREEKGAVVPRKLSPKEMKEMDGAEIGSVLQEEKLFGTDSRYSPKYSSVEDRVVEVRNKMEEGIATDEDRTQLFKDLDTLQSLVAADEERRADGTFLSQMTGLQKAFLEDIAAAYEKAKRA
jgi:ABC-type dipeptide/oligopeptide/nickel transport system ATPase component